MENAKRYKAIVMGASAGGLVALSSILQGLPRDYPLPVIVVQHRVKDQKHLLEDVLQSKCRVRIKQADEKEKIENGVIYFAPADYHLLIEDDKTFSLSYDEPVQFSRPSIDVLFESAALVYRNKLVGIVLSGANRDGANGINAIRSQGGLTIAQDPVEAMAPMMPEAAIETKGIEYVWSIAQIQSFLLALNL